MEITKSDLMAYKILPIMIEREEKKLIEYQSKMPSSFSGKVYGSNPQFPFEPKGFSVVGMTKEDKEKMERWNEKCEYMENIIKKDIETMKNLKIKIDEMIADIKDTTDKMIFQYTVDGKTQEWIAKRVGLEQSAVSKRIKKYLKN